MKHFECIEGNKNVPIYNLRIHSLRATSIDNVLGFNKPYPMSP